MCLIAGAFVFDCQRLFLIVSVFVRLRTGGIKIGSLYTGRHKIGSLCPEFSGDIFVCLFLETFNGDRFTVVSLVQTYYDY